MFVNHTGLTIFEDFEERYQENLIEKYNHIKRYKIHCYTFEQYRQLANVPKVVFNDGDSFCFAADDNLIDNSGNAFAAIIISQGVCSQLDFTHGDYMAAIAHEMGHIIHASSQFLNCAHESWKEIFADMVVKDIGLSAYLISLLEKLRRTNRFSEYQNSLFDKRIERLN